MKAHLLIMLASASALVGWEPPPWPHVGPMPDDPATGGPPGYQSVTAGTKSYRPVEPLPWGDINRRVAPPEALSPDKTPAPKNGKAVRPKQSPPHSKH